jgi:hypothetical protein
MKVFSLYEIHYAYDGPIREWHVRVEPRPMAMLRDDGDMEEVCVVTYDNPAIGDEDTFPRNASVRFFL